MKILALADVESPALWDYFEPDRLKDIDVIISCGDLAPQYLSFLATFFSGPVLYVHGNHDGCYEKTPPDGCISIEDRIYEYQGVRFLGLGGSMRYKPGPFQFTQTEMNRRVRRLWFQLKRRKGFDVLVAHSPAYGLGHGEDLTHTGFKAFLRLMEQYRPAVFIHGHVHLSYAPTAARKRNHGDTAVINAYERYVFEI